MPHFIEELFFANINPQAPKTPAYRYINIWNEKFTGHRLDRALFYHRFFG